MTSLSKRELLTALLGMFSLCAQYYANDVITDYYRLLQEYVKFRSHLFGHLRSNYKLNRFFTNTYIVIGNKNCDINISTISLRVYNIRFNFIMAILTFCGYALFFLVSYTEFAMAKKRCINMIYKQNMAW